MRGYHLVPKESIKNRVKRRLRRGVAVDDVVDMVAKRVVLAGRFRRVAPEALLLVLEMGHDAIFLLPDHNGDFNAQLVSDVSCYNIIVNVSFALPT